MSRKLSTRHARLLKKVVEEYPEEYVPPVKFKTPAPIEAMNANQQSYIDSIDNYTLTFGTGPAGVGKTWLCAAMAADALNSGLTKKIIITRPAVEAGESLGFLPGELDEKYAPYLTPFIEVLNERLSRGKVDTLLKNKTIEAVPLAYMRGRTFKYSWVILDEAQNTTPAQMKMFLTRIGQGSTVIVNGDEEQCDLPGPSGLTDAINKISYIPSVKVIRFTKADVVRHDLVQEIIEAYANKSTNNHNRS